MVSKEIIRDYIIGEKNFDIDGLINRYYGYVYTIVNNSKNKSMTEEDVEEIISDVFMAIWNNRNKIEDNTVIRPYLVGIIKNIISKKYRCIKLEYSINDYEEILSDMLDIEKTLELKEQSDFIEETLKSMKQVEYKIFIMFYYEGKKIDDIAKELHISTSNVKVSLHRIRKRIRKSLKQGGYDYGK